MKKEIKELSEMYALGAISAEQIKEESACTNEEYYMSLWYAELFENQYYNYIEECRMIDTALNNIAEGLRAHGYLVIREGFSFTIGYQTIVRGCPYDGYDLDVVEETITPIEAFNIIHDHPLVRIDDVIYSHDELPF